jgi:hypothetical protein
MTTHLSPDDLAAAADGSLEAARARHLEQCPDCRAAVAELSAALATVRSEAVPEPSPLFWNHFSARVAEVTNAESLPAKRPWTFVRPAIALGALAAVAVLLVVWSSSRERHPSMPAPATVAVEGPADAEVSWQGMSEIAAAMTADDVRSATASAPEPSTVLSELSADERAAFVELLKHEIGDVQ